MTKWSNKRTVVVGSRLIPQRRAAQQSATRATDATASGNCHQGIRAFLLLAVTCVVLPVTNSAAQVRAPSVRHIIDTSTDRIPALTAFPKYPSIARRDRIEGETTVCFKIRANGKVSRVVVTDSSHKIFSKPALRAMRKSTFEPIGPGQVLATARSCRTFRFRLDPVLVSAPDN